MLDNLESDDCIERAVSEGKPRAIALDKTQARVGVLLAARRQRISGLVESDDLSGNLGQPCSAVSDPTASIQHAFRSHQGLGEGVPCPVFVHQVGIGLPGYGALARKLHLR